MDAEFWLNGICFKWDRKKATSNLRDHHIAFESACEVFFRSLHSLAEFRDG